MKKLIFIITILCMSFQIFAQTASEDSVSSDKRKRYWKISFSDMNFNNSGLNNEVGTMFGLQTAGGIEIQRNLTAELNVSEYWKKINSNKKLNVSSLAVFFDYHPANFYIGAGPVFEYIELREKVQNTSNDYYHWERYSKQALGFGFRLGYTIRLGNFAKLYGELNYSKINVDDDSNNINIGTTGGAIGFLF